MPLPSRSIDAEQTQSASPIAVESAMISLREAAMSVSPIVGVSTMESAILDATSSLEDSMVDAMDRNTGQLKKLTSAIIKERRKVDDRRVKNISVDNDRRSETRRSTDFQATNNTNNTNSSEVLAMSQAMNSENREIKSEKIQEKDSENIESILDTIKTNNTVPSSNTKTPVKTKPNSRNPKSDDKTNPENKNILQFFKSEFDTRFEDVKERSVDQISSSAFDLKSEFISELGPLGGVVELGIDFLGGAAKSLAASGFSTLRKSRESDTPSGTGTSIQDVTSEFSEKVEETSVSSTDTLNTSIQNVEDAIRETSPTLEERREAKRGVRSNTGIGKIKNEEPAKSGGLISNMLNMLGMQKVGGFASKAAGGIAGAVGLSKIAGSVLPKTTPAVQPVIPTASPDAPSRKGSIFKSIGKGLIKGARFIPGVGLALAAGSALASGGMAAYNSIQSGGSIGDAIGNGLQGAASDLTFGLIPSPAIQKESGETLMGQSVNMSTENLDKMSTEELQKLRTSTETLAVMKSNNLSRMTNASSESNDIAAAKFYNEQSMKVIDDAQSKISMIDKELSSRSNVESATEQNMKSIEMEVRASTNRGRGSVSGGVGNNVVAPVSNDNRVVNNNTTVVNAPDTDPTIRNLNNNLFGQFAR